MNAAKATVSQNLDNMRSAYEAHGGGIRGAAAAAVEGVKGIYTAGFTFLDNLTGGRLSAIRDKFVGFVTNIASGVSERFTAVKTAFSNGITAIKNTVTGAVTWFFESGKRVVTTFANGIKSAFTGAVDAVKGRLAAHPKYASLLRRERRPPLDADPLGTTHDDNLRPRPRAGAGCTRPGNREGARRREGYP